MIFHPGARKDGASGRAAILSGQGLDDLDVRGFRPPIFGAADVKADAVATRQSPNPGTLQRSEAYKQVPLDSRYWPIRLDESVAMFSPGRAGPLMDSHFLLLRLFAPWRGFECA